MTVIGASQKQRRCLNLNVDELVEGILSNSRSVLGRAITIVESHNPVHRLVADDIVARLLPHSGSACRIGITGVPGVGKSTFIEVLGTMLVDIGHKVAVLAVDPSSIRTGGSILGDKTRMEKLSVNPSAFIRPSPSSGTLGGVASRTRETIILCEAASYDIVLVETVGVGQSETIVSDMVDFFLVLMLPGAGDELQGIKKGILEIADMIVINKADGNNETSARLAAAEYRNALRIVASENTIWKTPITICSALHNIGIDSLWQKIVEHQQLFSENGELQKKRRQQQIRWMWSLLDSKLIQLLHHHPAVKKLLPQLEQDIAASRISPPLAVERIINTFFGQHNSTVP